jgi:hypothetical protein
MQANTLNAQEKSNIPTHHPLLIGDDIPSPSQATCAS